MFDPNINTVELYINGRYFCRIVDPDISVHIESTEKCNQRTSEDTTTNKESNISVNGHCDFSSKWENAIPRSETISGITLCSNSNKDTTPRLRG